MRSAFLLTATLLGAQPAAPPPMVPPAKAGELPCDAKDHQPLLLGVTTRQAILAHRAVFREATAAAQVPDALRARWKAVKQPLTLVAVFGSWCGDSQRELPELLALEAEPNPFIEVHYLGVYRDKKLDAAAWPQGCPPQAVDRVPTFYLFALQPGGGQKLVGSIVETPPKPGQRMAEALVELAEKGSLAF